MPGTFDALSPTPRLRGFRPEDVPTISAIVAEALHEHYDPSLYASLGADWPEGFLVAATEHERPVGFLLGVNQVPGESRVLMFAVERAARGSGVGHRLMDTFLERSRRRGFRRATLEVRVSNVGAIRFYTRYRYSVIDLLRNYYSDGENGYHMARELEAAAP
ncbi:MAG TPA: GNAT family N-acetyltransferase [Thermoplasmata archaeon]|nr:GNAT family N-acetyltransferase [Thermoplasmata archaeon]